MGATDVDKDVSQSASGNALRERSSADYGAYLGVRETAIAKKHPVLTKKNGSKVDLKAKARRSSNVAEATLAVEADTASQGDGSKGTEAGSMSSCLVEERPVGAVESDGASVKDIAVDHALQVRAKIGNACEVSPEMLDGCDISTWPDFSVDPLGAGEIDDLDVPGNLGNLVLPDPEDALLDKPSGEATEVKREPAVTEDVRPSETFQSDSHLNEQSDMTSKDTSKSPAQKKKPKVDWTPELHRRFVQAVEQLGVDKAIPSRILELMGVKSLTRHNIASHLQKYRSHRRHLAARDAEAANWNTNRAPADSGASAGAWPAAAAAASAPAGTPGASGATWGSGAPAAGAAVSVGGTPANAVANGVPNAAPGGVSHGVPTGHPAAMMPPRQMPGMMPPCPPIPFRHQPYGNMPMMHPHQSSPGMSPMMPHPPPAMGMPVWGHPTSGGASPGGFPRPHMWGHVQQQQQQQQPQCQGQQQPQQQMQPRVAAYPPPSWLAVDGSSPWHHYPAFPAGPPPMDAWPHPGMPARGMPCFPPRQHQHPLSYPIPPNGPPNGAPNGAPNGPPRMVCGAPVCPPNGMPPNGYPHNAAPSSGSHANGGPAMMPPPPFFGMPMMPGLPHAPGFGPSPAHGWGMGGMFSGAAGGAGGGGAGGDGGAGDAAHVADEAMPNPMFPLSDDLTVDLAAISASIGDDLHEANDILDAAISEALTNPATPLPLGLKPPSLDGVLDELNRQGIRMPASAAATAAAAAAAGAGADADADIITAAAGVDGDGDDEGILSLTDYPAGLFCSAEAMAAAASFLKEEAV
ncbi:unnamed protein product [Closterium sp. Yama58-4]|nr:unnamed protein product [Closterium sp. Yama58-4]